MHDYAIDWTGEGIAWEIDGSVVRTSPQSPAYGMQLMLGIYAFAPVPPDADASFRVEHVRGFAPTADRRAAASVTLGARQRQ
jgi:hypothetical protein